MSGSDKVTFAHEYTHALQDSNFPGVFDVQADLLEESDQALARAAITEGDATLAMTYWMLPNLTPTDLQDVLAAGTDPETTAILERTPAILTEDLTFPYEVGGLLLQGVQTNGGWAAVDAVYDDMPVSTEQVLHPEKYAAGEAPIEVTADDIAGGMGDTWTEDLQDTFGEFQTGVWLREHGLDEEAATAASAGWAVTASHWSVARTAAGPSSANDLGHEQRRARIPGRRGAGGRGRPEPGHGHHRRRRRPHGHLRQRRPHGRRGRGRRRLPARGLTPLRSSGYIDSGAEIPRRPSVRASVTCVARARARRAAERSGASASTTRASR